jgi:glycosyltransferase involved in cell wall biosynthesis
MNRRLTIVIHSLDGGGAERIASWMANHWVRADNHVTLITLDLPHTDRYEVDPRVERIALGLMAVSRNALQAVVRNLMRRRKLAQAIAASQPNWVISLTDKTNVLTLLACRGVTRQVVVYELTDPRHHDIGRYWSWLRRWTYPGAYALVVQTESVRQWFRQWLKRVPIHIIPTGVPRQETTEPVERPPGYRILAVGRLEPVKGYDLLIEAFARIAAIHPQWHLWIAGSGSLYAVLQREIKRRGLEKRVKLWGHVAHPEVLMQQSDLFVLSSRYEGFPTALLEAMASGLPAVSFDCQSGPADIIRQGVDGLLVPPEDVGALATAMSRLMSDEGLRQAMAERAREVATRFSQERFFERWEEVLR